VGLVGFLLRLLVPLIGGGLTGRSGNDPGVYYAAADALTHGLLPYHDFATVHPPLLSYLLTPFALLGRITTDQTGLAAAAFATCLLGGVNAALVTRVAQRWGCSLLAATLGGLVYACSYASITAEHTSRLEPPGNLFLLLALLALAPASLAAPDLHRPRHPLPAGLALGAAVSTKIWWAAPALVLLVVVGFTDRRWPATARWRSLLDRRGAGGVLAGGFLSAFAINIVPFVVDPSSMFNLVVEHQLDRAEANGTVLDRISGMAGMDVMHHPPAAPVIYTVAIAALVVIALAAVLAAGTPLGRLVVPLLAIQVIVIVSAPSWYYYYTDFTAVAIALTVAAGVASGRTALPPSLAAGSVLIGLGIFAMSTTAVHAVVPLDGLEALEQQASRFRCVTADSPTALIEINALDRSFSPPCHDWVDVPGLRLGGDGASGFRLIPDQHMSWRRLFGDYLRSGQAAVVGRSRRLPPEVLQAVRDNGQLIGGVRGYELYRITNPVALPSP